MFTRSITLVPLRRPRNKVQIVLGPKEDPEDCFKDRAAWLLEGLNATHSHRHGYCLSPQRAEAFQRLYNAGFHASHRLLFKSGPAKFHQHNGPQLTLKEALAQCPPLTPSQGA